MAADLVRMLCALVQIESTNPGTYEKRLAHWIANWLGDHSPAQVELVETLPGRPSVGARIGRPSGPSLLLNAHLDTVPVDDRDSWAFDPFSGIEHDGAVFGRGACDTKPGIAIQLALARDFGRRSDWQGELVLHFAVGEENAEEGTQSLLDAGYAADNAVVFEPTDLAVGVATRGLAHVGIEIVGRAGHASTPRTAVNPIDALPAVLERLSRYGQALGLRHRLLGTGTATVTVVHAGGKDNVIPDVCSVVVDRRLVPGETLDGELERLRAIIVGLAAAFPALQFTLAPRTAGFEPAEVTSGSNFPGHLAAISERVLGRPVREVALPYACDLSRLLGRRPELNAAVFGPGRIEQAHARDEYVAVNDLVAAGRVIFALAEDLLSAPGG